MADHTMRLSMRHARLSSQMPELIPHHENDKDTESRATSAGYSYENLAQ